KDKQVRDTQEEMTRRLNERNENLEAEITKYRNLVAESQQKITTLQAKNTTLSQEVARLQAIARDRILQIQRENQGLREVIEKWSREAGRREQVKVEPYDGRIIQVDINNKFVVVDLGRQHRVHRGMRFDVIRWRLNKWDYMGQIELTKVDSTTSQGVILDAIVQQRICPLCGYVAKEPEEQVCPYCRGGASRDRVVELVKGDVEEKASMRKLDPIVVGDYITNPFYSKERQLRFVVAGEMLRYTPDEIKNQIKKFGGEIQDKVDVDTDYLVLGQIPEESAVAGSEEQRKRRDLAVASLKTAKDYGIPIMREVELFEFLRY
ncbi:MAG: hypothetical protein N3A66_06975, partial [Planctomycetota bacterium]|nr:hypothetical protein [Planctomycetota bacterium]